MIVAACVHIFFLMNHRNKVLSVLAELGKAEHLPNTLGWPGCRCWQIIAKERLIIVHHENVRSRDDSENRGRSFDSLAFVYCAYDARILSRPISFETNGVMGDLLEIGQTKL
jgi:hypothetical protein